MAGSVNKVIILGNLGANPEIKYLPSGQAVCEMRVATSEVYKDKQDQRQERTEWHRIVVFAQPAEFCEKYLAKGALVYVEGRIQTRSWDDKSGNKRYSTEIVAAFVRSLSSSSNGNGTTTESTDSTTGPTTDPDAPPPADGDYSDDQVPF